ncbi:aminoacyl-tRNA hydrolase [Sulfurovum sp. NBC37-1]|uniref:Peptidyl-tRNA hydrolase n=1 Tax=Sulfurovum sp. (strain NBC37-1) TaxID=387093 RepID=PTH_SULNB|nr:aminoacyl-tRNA hydrolase [Sulfurovum sp. NBC37-1]A6QBZ2.1 RecName: Full=Peptidyl-tRNA hydrolase; Short=PTH [Sulfurovum sp. NBC37-1]BAF73001.1 peptidyl-tRNA hydrolase, PTH1 family [Sulfurovum sp. NBC37-1]
MTLFVGLGNPGSKYEDTRHNIGFKVIDSLVDDLGARNISKNAFQGELYRIANTLFLKPTTFMNLSGKSIETVKQFFKIELEDIIVIHDDIDLPFGAVRFKRGGGHGGHNGLRSLDAHIGKEYIRVRIGVGKPEHKSQVADYVLHRFSEEEEKEIERLVKHVSNACKALLCEDLNKVKSYYSLKSIEGLE